MKKFKLVTATVLPLDRSNVDTDAIIPKQFLKSIKRSGFGPNLFDEWRYLDQGEPGLDCSKRPLNPDFVLNKDRYKAVEILLARENFGCGSSREHAPWALEDYGFKVIIAPSFADIFFNNCFKNGVLPIVLAASQVDQLFAQALSTEGYALTVNLEQQIISVPGQANINFEVDEFRKFCLINGLDDIGLTLEHTDIIKAYEQKRAQSEPWIIS
ncbi:3-isopropylmalate dehydratase small subunit [hydrothermal vent metagenome]|uniref:3-isopropylmalate dehydratase n=1 Tax=hydrothermal vent metagenome TaxID=652676 RepID=A0A3B0Y9D9_9ZZZZ